VKFGWSWNGSGAPRWSLFNSGHKKPVANHSHQFSKILFSRGPRWCKVLCSEIEIRKRV
jgi:hypothetical protein